MGLEIKNIFWILKKRIEIIFFIEELIFLIFIEVVLFEELLELLGNVMYNYLNFKFCI